jgi:hypothetical protein
MIEQVIRQSHVFFDDISSPPNGPTVYDDEFDLGSGTEDEDESACLNATSRASVSSVGESPSNWPDSITSKPASSTQSQTTGSVVSSPSVDETFSSIPTVLAESSTGRPPNRFASNRFLPLRESLQYLGNMTRHSVELDWAVVEISHAGVASTVYDLKTSAQREGNDEKLAPNIESEDVVAHTSRGPIPGKLSRDMVSMRLPSSNGFHRVHQVVLDSALEWGDCGVRVSDAATAEPYGHVVVTSATKEIAYIAPAQEVFETSRTQWEPNSRSSLTSLRVIDLQGSYLL